MSIAYIVGYSSGSGTTAMAVGLATSWKNSGKKVLLIPAADGTASDIKTFVDSVLPSNNEAELFLRAERDGKIELLREWQQSYDVIVIDGGASTETPQNRAEIEVDIINGTHAKVLGVIGYDRSINREEVRKWSRTYGDHFTGLIVNKCHKYSTNDVDNRLLPALSLDGISMIKVIPEKRVLIAPTVAQVVEHIQGKYFANADRNEDLVEHLLIGGLITEWGGNYFNRFSNQAVIVRGGRIDIQMSALNFPLNLLILTNCETPSQYVFQRAEDLGVPLVTVSSDTHQTMSLLETLHSRVNVMHPEKINYLSGLLDEDATSHILGQALGVL